MPPLRSTLVQEDFSDGEQQGVARSLISPAGVYRLGDALLDEEGNPYRRGGTAYKSDAGLGVEGLTWVWDGYLKPGARTVFANAADFGVLAADDKAPVNLGGVGLAFPKQAAVLEELLFIGGGSIYGGSRKSAVYSDGTVKVTNGSTTVTGAGTAWTANVDPGMLFHIGAERVYVVASVDSDTKLTLRDAYQGVTGEGKAYTLSPVWTVGGSDPYENYDHLTVCANRLVLLSGRKIRFTEVNNPHSFTNSLGTTNEHTLAEGAEGVGLATIGQTVLVFTTRGVWALDGLALDIVDQNGNNQHRLQQLSNEMVLAGAAGLAGAEQRLVVPAADGIFLMDGISSPVRISRPIDRLYGRYLADGYRVGGAIVYRGHYFLPIIDSDGQVRDLRVCRLDRASQHRGETIYPWSRFTGDGGEISAFAVRTTVNPRRPLLFGAQAREPSRVVDCTGYFEPSSAVETDADGSPHSLDIITRDFQTGDLTANVVRALEARYELIGNDDPRLQVSYSEGGVDTGGAKFGEAKFGEATFGGEGASFVVIGESDESGGRSLAKFRLNKKLRFVRFRIRSSGAAAVCALRLLKLNIRPSGASRR